MIKGMLQTAGMLILLGACTGCGTLVRSSHSCQFHTYKEYDLAIKYYEEERVLPPSNTFTIAECYAFRSVCLAQQVPWFGQTRMALKGVNSEAAEYDKLAIAWALWTPVCLIQDVVSLPFDAYSTANLRDEQLQHALSDLQHARRLGYKQLVWYPEAMFVPARKHLDQLGFIAKPYHDKSEPPAAASPSQGRQKLMDSSGDAEP